MADATTTHLDEADVAYLRELVKANEQTEYAVRHFLAHLGKRYSLGEGVGVELSGEILRKAKDTI